MAGVPNAGEADGVFTNLGNRPLIELIRTYGNVPIVYKNYCDELNVPYYYYYAFKYYVDFMDGIDIRLKLDMYYFASRCLIHTFKRFKEEDCVYEVIFYYMIIRSFCIFHYTRNPNFEEMSHAPAG